jgi:hypothetical protein
MSSILDEINGVIDLILDKPALINRMREDTNLDTLFEAIARGRGDVDDLERATRALVKVAIKMEPAAFMVR